uniref:Uncharacterized protein n=1 Tax=Loa loa TaxID=7209 RepID=A0A1I7VZY0_LOALO
MVNWPSASAVEEPQRRDSETLPQPSPCKLPSMVYSGLESEDMKVHPYHCHSLCEHTRNQSREEKITQKKQCLANTLRRLPAVPFAIGFANLALAFLAISALAASVMTPSYIFVCGA